MNKQSLPGPEYRQSRDLPSKFVATLRNRTKLYHFAYMHFSHKLRLNNHNHVAAVACVKASLLKTFGR